MKAYKPQWQKIIAEEKNKPYFKQMMAEINKQRTAGIDIYPPENEVFSAFCDVDLSQVNVVVLGQDPYHGAGQAHGLAFSVKPNIKTPPSLVNIYKELFTDIDGFVIPEHGSLVTWAQQGVLLLNTVLTVQQAKAHSHAKLGWQQFTDTIIEKINQNNPGCVFILWGSHAQKKGKNIDQNKHYVLAGPHPSPLSAYRGFFGCKHFSKANMWLTKQGRSEVNWHLD